MNQMATVHGGMPLRQGGLTRLYYQGYYWIVTSPNQPKRWSPVTGIMRPTDIGDGYMMVSNSHVTVRLHPMRYAY